jgi:hypothetical protein
MCREGGSNGAKVMGRGRLSSLEVEKLLIVHPSLAVTPPPFCSISYHNSQYALCIIAGYTLANKNKSGSFTE